MDKKTPEFLYKPKRLLNALGRFALDIVTQPLRPDFVMDDVHALTSATLDKVSPTTHVLVFDIEGTLENYKDPAVSKETVDLFERMQKAGYTIVINSNAPDKERTDTVHNMFDGLVGSDLVITSYDTKQAGYKHGGKPHSSMLKLTETRLAERKSPYTSPQFFLMIGDQLAKDVLAGKNAGAKTLLVNKYGPDDHKDVARWQRTPERIFMQTLGLKALKGAESPYLPLDLPKDITRLSDYRKTLRAKTSRPQKTA